MKGKKNWDWFECHICKRQSYDEDDFIYCDECNKSTCYSHIKFIQHQGYEESLCDKCINKLNIKKEEVEIRES